MERFLLAAMVVLVAVVVAVNVLAGGMRSITLVQAFQYWIKLTAVAVPAVFVVGLFLSDARTLDRPTAPQFAQRTVSDYDHLARVREWQVTEEEEE